MTSGTPATTPNRPSPSPRRSGGSSAAVRAPVTTPMRPKPRPRATLAVTVMTSGPPGSSARAGIPSSTAPAASTGRYAYRFISSGAASSAATVPSKSIPVTSPAPALPAPAAAYLGVTERSRSKLVRAQNSNKNTRASGRLMIRPPVVLPSVSRLGAVRVNALMLVTVRSEWSADKFQYHGDSVVRFGSGAAAATRPRQRAAAALPAGSGPARGNPERPAEQRRAAAVIAGTGS